MPLRAYIPRGEGPQERRMLMYREADEALQEVYSAWQAVMEERNRPVPDWETYSVQMAGAPEAGAAVRQLDPHFLAEDPLFISAENTRYMRGLMGLRDNLDQFLQAEEFVPENMREDYRRLADMFRGICRDIDTMMRADRWLDILRQEDPTRELLSRRNERGMTEAEARFCRVFRQYRVAGNAQLDKDVIYGTQIGHKLMVMQVGRNLLRYALGDDWLVNGEQVRLIDRTAPENRDILSNYGPNPDGADKLAGHLLYGLAQRFGIDPDSIVDFVQELRQAITAERSEDRDEPLQEENENAASEFIARWRAEREYDEAVMYLAAWRDSDAAEIVRLARDVTEEFESTGLSSEEAVRRLKERLGSLSEDARETLIANFDKTFGKYFSDEQMRDGTAFARIRAGGVSLADRSRDYGGERPQAERMAKTELMARVLAGDSIEVERVFSDGTVKRVPLRLETRQPALAETVENSVRIRMEQAGRTPLRQTMEQRRAGLHRMFENVYREGRFGVPYLDQSGAEAELRGRMQRDARTALAWEGIFDSTAASTLGAGEVEGLRGAVRELTVYRAALHAAQRQEYDRYLRFVQRCAENLNQIRSDQELIRTYPSLQAAEIPGGPQGLRVSGRSLDQDLMEREAARLYQAGTALEQALRYGMGEGGPEDLDGILNGDGGQALRELLEAEGLTITQLQEMANRIRREAPENGSRFADAEAIPMELAAAGDDIVGLFRPRVREEQETGPQEQQGTQGEQRLRERPQPVESEIDLALLGPEARQYAARNFDAVMGPVFGAAARERLAARGMDLYDCIFVEGRSLSDIYRQTPERRPYEQMESDMKCRFLENVLAGKRIDVMVTDAAGKAAVRRLLPYDSSGVLAASRVLARDGISIPESARYQAAGPEEEDRIRSAVDESVQRLENTLADPAALMSRKEYIRYGRGNGVPARVGFAEPPHSPQMGKVLTARLPLDEAKEWNAGQKEALAALWSMQLHEPGAKSNGSLPNRLRISGDDPASEENQQIRQVLDMTEEMFTNLLRETEADRVDPQVMRKMGLRTPEQLFYIDGMPAETYLRGMSEYADLTPDYRPDSAYMRALRGEIISATMGNVSSVDLILPVEDVLGIRPRMWELHVDYSSDLMQWEYVNGDNARVLVNLGDRQKLQWTGSAPADTAQELGHIYPVTDEAQSSRQRQVLEELRQNHRPRIWLAGSPGAQLMPGQRNRILELRRYRPTGRRPMPEPLRDAANSIYEEISRQLGLGEQEKKLLLDTGVIASEAEMFYINGMPALDYVRQNVPSLRNLRKDAADFDRILKAEVAAAAVSGGHMVEVGRVATDRTGKLIAGVADVHVDLDPVRLSSDGTLLERNTVLRAPGWDVNRDQRREGIRTDMQAKVDRAGAIRYAAGNNVAYSAAARRFDPDRPDMTAAYIGGEAGVGDLVRRYGNFLGSDEEAARMLASLAQMYLLSRDPTVHLTDLVDPDSLKDEKRAAGKAVIDALRKGMEGRGWENYDEIVAGVAQMVSPIQAQGPAAQPGTARTLDMRRELAAVMGLDPNRKPAYSQAEFLRYMDLPENSPRVSAMLAFAGQIAGDAKRMGLPRMESALGRTGSLAQWERGRTEEFARTADALQLAGRAESEWLNSARNYQRIEDGQDPEELAAAAGGRMNLEEVRQIFAAGGSLSAHAGDIGQALDTRHRDYYRELYRRQDPPAPRVRDMAESSYGGLALNGRAPMVTVSIELPMQQRRMEEMDTLVSLADRKQELPAELDGFVAAYAADVFDRMFERGAEPIFGLERMERLSGCGLDMLDRIYIEGNSVRDLYGEKYSGLSPEEARNRMKTEFVVQMLRGARIDVAAERNGVEVLSALAVETDIRRINRRAWLTVPDGTVRTNRFIDPAEPVDGLTLPPMPAEIAGRIYTSQWTAAERAVRAAGGPAPAAEQEGPETQRVRAFWQEEHGRRRDARVAEDRLTGEVPDSAAMRMKLTSDIDEPGGVDFRDQLFLLYTGGEEKLKEIFAAGEAVSREDGDLMRTAVGWMDKVIQRATYARDNADTSMRIPNRLQEMLGYGSRNLSEMFLIDGMSVDEYARQQKLDVWAADSNVEANRRAILAVALLTGEHHVDMVRAGLMTDEALGVENVYKTGVAEIQMDLSPFDELVRFYQTRPSRKAGRLYGDTAGRNERHEKIRQAADAKLFQALTREQMDEETEERRDLEEAMTRDRLSQWRAARPQANPAQPRQTTTEPVSEPRQITAGPAGPQVQSAAEPRRTESTEPQMETRQTEPVSEPRQTEEVEPQAKSGQTEPVSESRQTTTEPAGPQVAPAAEPQVESRQTEVVEPQPKSQPSQPPAAEPKPKSQQSQPPRPEEASGKKKIGLAGIEKLSTADVAEKEQSSISMGRGNISREDDVVLTRSEGKGSDRCWSKYLLMRMNGNIRPDKPESREQYSAVQTEYRALAWEFRRLMTGSLWSPGMDELANMPDTMPAGMHRGFGHMIDDVREFLYGTDAAKREEALERFQNPMDMREDIFRFSLPKGMNFGDPKQIQAHRGEFDSLYRLSGLLIDIDRALNPPESRNKNLEVLHSVCGAAARAYDPSLAMAEKDKARDVLSVLAQVQEGADSQELAFMKLADVVDRLTELELGDYITSQMPGRPEIRQSARRPVDAEMQREIRYGSAQPAENRTAETKKPAADNKQIEEKQPSPVSPKKKK